jgi:glycosyltransferase involved in cell wall biosynthesis
MLVDLECGEECRVKKPKLLFVAGRPPYPLDTGAKIRSWHILTCLCQKYQVDVLCYRCGSRDCSWEAAATSIGVGKLVEIDNQKLDYKVTPFMFISSVMRRLPVTVTKYQTKAMTEMFRELLEDDYDLVHIEHVHLSGLLKYVTDPKIVCSLDAHNVETQIADRMRDMESSLLRKTGLAVHAHNMMEFEKCAFSNSDFIMAVSSEDIGSIKMMSDSKARVSLVENGVDIEYFTPANNGLSDVINNNGFGNSVVGKDEIVFVGSMDWLPNIDGVEWFVKETFPLIKAQKPYCRFTIVGRNPHPSIKALDDPSRGIIVTGTVDDVRKYVRESSVVVVPLRYGGGTRLKILEAFAMGVPVVSTALGCEGITYENDRELLLADSPRALAEACVQLLSDGKKAAEIAKAARKLALRKYSWDVITQNMLISLDALSEEKMQA